MNERIKELLEQCTDPTMTNPWSLIDAEKFAESIVQKFDDILVLEQLDCVGNKDKQAVERVERLREKVKTYFGVEE